MCLRIREEGGDQTTAQMERYWMTLEVATPPETPLSFEYEDIAQTDDDDTEADEHEHVDDDEDENE